MTTDTHWISGQLYKEYSGSDRSVLNGVKVELSKGEIYLLAGRNGSGKTTLLRILAGLDNENHFLAVDKEKISYMNDSLIYFDYMRAGDMINFCARDARFERDMANRLLIKFGLTPGMKIKRMSSGQKRMLGFLLAVSKKAELYLIDEPFPYLDVSACAIVREAIIERANEDNVFVISTHQISGFERVATKVLFLKDSENLVSLDPEQLREDEGVSVEEFLQEVLNA